MSEVNANKDEEAALASANPGAQRDVRGISISEQSTKTPLLISPTNRSLNKRCWAVSEAC